MVLPLPHPEPDWALFLDVDGTLIEIAETPDRATPHQRVPEVLSAVTRALGGAVALVSGRPIATLDRLLAPLRLPAAGLHGLERRTANGDVTRPAKTPSMIAETKRRFDEFAARNPGTQVEDKGLTVALHYRQAPELGEAVRGLAECVVRGHADAVMAQTGKMVVEIRPTGPDKGTVIEAFMAEKPFASRTPVFVGDDVTDEAAFTVVNALCGHSIRVGGREPTAARSRIDSVGRLLDWLASLPSACEGGERHVAGGEP